MRAPWKSSGTRMRLGGVLLRSFTLQGSWNYRTMLGGGFAFAILPVLRRLHQGDPEGLQKAVRRHCEHFNAHPYLSGVALGAVVRMEAEGVDPEQIRRFKTAVRGPLGGLGDTLVWAGGLPALLLVALAFVILDAPAWMAPLGFLGGYNLGHLALRLWGFRVGFRNGPSVGTRLRDTDLRKWGGRIQALGIVALGSVLALLFLSSGPAGGIAVWWAAPAGALFVLGVFRGRELWRLAGVVFTFVLVGFFVLGAMT